MPKKKTHLEALFSQQPLTVVPALVLNDLDKKYLSTIFPMFHITTNRIH